MKYIIACIVLLSLNCSATKVPEEPGIRILSYNILGYAPNSGYPKKTLVYLAMQDAEIILLQEYTNYFHAKVKKILDEDYPYQHAVPNGLAIYSKIPLGKADYIKGPQFRPTALCTTVTEPAFALCNIHFKSPAYAVRAPIKRFLTAYQRNVKTRTNEWLLVQNWHKKKGNGLPFITAGDFNTMELAEFHDKEFKPNFRDTMLTASPVAAATFPNPEVWGTDEALFRLDYILYTEPFRARWAKTDESGGSDHFPVRAELVLKPNS